MKSFSASLLEWYVTSRRILPWREDPTPYHVFLSEIMLQQTRVDTVIPYYERFLAVYPSFEALAKANEGDVYLLWQGLGYYSRARNLHKAAKVVQERFGGALPSDKALLLDLPGVGEYVSSAVLSIAFDKPAVAVDGNLLRVYARYNAKPIDVTSYKSKKDCESFFLEHMDSPSRFNQALMDLGELVCLPHGEPKCEICPLKEKCKGRAQGNPIAYPLPKKKNTVRKEELSVLLAYDSHGNIAIRKRKDGGLLAGLYEFPNESGRLSLCDLSKKYPSLKEIRYVGIAKHRFSHVEWTMSVYEAQGEIEGCEHVPFDELKKRYSLPTAFSKLLDLLG